MPAPREDIIGMEGQVLKSDDWYLSRPRRSRRGGAAGHCKTARLNASQAGFPLARGDEPVLHLRWPRAARPPDPLRRIRSLRGVGSPKSESSADRFYWRQL